jgi:hypothetical protein
VVNRKRAGGLVLLAAGVYGLILSLYLPMGKWNEPGAGAFPLIVSILLCLSGFFICVRAGEQDIAVLSDILRRQWIPFQIVLFTAGFIIALEKLGYLATASLYTFALLFWVSRYRVWVAFGLAVLIGVGSWLVFGKLFATPLPQGAFSL